MKERPDKYRDMILEIRRLWVFIVLSCFTSCVAKNDYSKFINQDAYSTRITLLDGTYKSIENYRGCLTVFFFWAQWCPYSRSTIVKLEKLARENINNGIKFVTISVDKYEDFQDLTDFINTQNLQTLEHAFSGNGLYDEAFLTYKVQEFPSFVVVDQNWKIVAYTTDISAIQKRIDENRLENSCVG